MAPQEELRVAIRALVLDSPMSQAEIARRLGITPKHLCAMLTGRATLTLEWAAHITGALHHRLRITVEPDDRAQELLMMRALSG